MNRIFSTLSDAEARMSDSLDWEWAGAASHDGWVRYVYDNQDQIERDADGQFATDDLLADYLRSVGENPANYSL